MNTLRTRLNPRNVKPARIFRLFGGRAIVSGTFETGAESVELFATAALLARGGAFGWIGRFPTMAAIHE